MLGRVFVLQGSPVLLGGGAIGDKLLAVAGDGKSTDGTANVVAPSLLAVISKILKLEEYLPVTDLVEPAGVNT